MSNNKKEFQIKDLLSIVLFLIVMIINWPLEKQGFNIKMYFYVLGRSIPVVLLGVFLSHLSKKSAEKSKKINSGLIIAIVLSILFRIIDLFY